MFCKWCGEKLNTDEKFCVYCGEPLGRRPQPATSLQPTDKKFPWLKYLLAIFAYCSLAGFAFINNIYLEEPIVVEEEYEANILSELGPAMEPVGYFDDMDLYDSETISPEEWLSHVKYLNLEEPKNTNTNNRFPDQNVIFSSVVKIVCEDDEYLYYGSGTSVDPAGYIITNYHVVEGMPEDGCMVGFPDPISGLIKEAYWVLIITDKAEETGHDLAYLVIDEPVFDTEGNLYGYFDKIKNGTFPYFEHSDECLNTSVQLGEKLLVLGYPPLSGGALTITDGLISSLYSQNGYIITSAKIVSGNSGGLAIDENGCFVGVPTKVYHDEETNDELLGEVIDAEFVFEFDRAIEDDLREYYEDNNITEISDVLSANKDDVSTDVIPAKVIVLEVPGALRSCASTDCEVVKYFAAGENIELVGQTGAWYKVQAKDGHGSLINGYIHQSRFEINTRTDPQ